MKNFVKVIIVMVMVALIVITYLVYKETLNKFIDGIITPVPKTEELTKFNEYSRRLDYRFVKHRTSLLVSEYEDIIDMYYSILDAGEEYTYFYCDKAYETCLDEVNIIAHNSTMLSQINNFVHPFNSFHDVKTTIHSNRKIEVRVNKSYTKEKIDYVNDRIDKIMAEEIASNLSIRDQIKEYHDYIIETTDYNENYENDENIRSKNAYDLFQTGESYCMGFSDALAIFLDRIKVRNYKIASQKHVWNFVFIDNDKLHIDMTWDNPVTNTGEKLLKHDFFLVDTEELLALDNVEHNFPKEIYVEAK